MITSGYLLENDNHSNLNYQSQALCSSQILDIDEYKKDM